MQEYEKYGNNCMQIARVISPQTPAQIKKHAECFFKQNLKTNAAAVKQYQESFSSNGKAQISIKHAAECNIAADALSWQAILKSICHFCTQYDMTSLLKIPQDVDLSKPHHVAKAT